MLVFLLRMPWNRRQPPWRSQSASASQGRGSIGEDRLRRRAATGERKVVRGHRDARSACEDVTSALKHVAGPRRPRRVRSSGSEFPASVGPATGDDGCGLFRRAEPEANRSMMAGRGV